MPPGEATTEPVDVVFRDIGGVILALESVRDAYRAFVEGLVDRHVSPHDVDGAIAVCRSTVGDYFSEREGTAFRPAREGYRRAVDAIVGPAADAIDRLHGGRGPR